MQEPDYEFPPRYALTSSAGHEEKRLQLEQAKAVDALHEFFESSFLSTIVPPKVPFVCLF